MRGLKQGGVCPECGHSNLASVEQLHGRESSLLMWTAAAYCTAVGASLLFTVGTALVPGQLKYTPYWSVAVWAHAILGALGFTFLATTPWCQLPLVWLAFSITIAALAFLQTR